MPIRSIIKCTPLTGLSVRFPCDVITFAFDMACTATLQALPYKRWFLQPPGDDLRLLDAGLPGASLVRLAEDLHVNARTVRTWLDMSRQATLRSSRRGSDLTRRDSESVLGLAKLVGQVQHLASACGTDVNFDAAMWLGEWLRQPLPAIAHRLPGELLATAAGRGVLSDLLDCATSSAYC